MGCCGKKRAQVSRESKAHRTPEVTEQPGSLTKLAPDPVPRFQYLGKTALTVIGPRTGKRYRFDRPGAVVTVDPIDSRALAAVTVLRQVRA